jgi:hypothetical protein
MTTCHSFLITLTVVGLYNKLIIKLRHFIILEISLEYRGIHDLLTLAGAFVHECVIDHRKHTIGTNMTLIRDIVKITC